ncbi:MAG TPA: hypothetical protein VM681_00850 [Candidatus Thermoplasmatota archaeon]|nr:hypothetical protein [Candidatus Thermoplasmatota archaeon]
METAPENDTLPLVASCRNCTSFAQAGCKLGVALPPERLLCERYTITDDFRDEIVEVMLKDVWTQVQKNTERVQKLQAARRLWN